MDSHDTSKKVLEESQSPTPSGSSSTPAQPSSPTPSNASTGSIKKDKDASTASTPASSNGSTGGKSSKNVPSSTPAINIFSNDGSFLDRFKKMKAEEDEKKKQLGALERKKAFEDRIKNRGKRKNQPTDEELDPKRVTLEDNERGETLDPKANAYLEEMQKYSERLCKDDSGHVRPLVK
ncbi:17293_t:CDS:2 [Cetraspora pellucida]|uniref:17293_t:CDS:1 n=1 Tax=Cetraspora pellucida TaxID=1433469 RepID=A0ACA9JZ42_9GLOM|nr:17293_t:CDS:2 [Cetraspora pellucida]